MEAKAVARTIRIAPEGRAQSVDHLQCHHAGEKPLGKKLVVVKIF